MRPTQAPTQAPNAEYTTFTNDVPNIPSRIAPAIESRKILTELDNYLAIVRQTDRTRQAFSNFY